MSLSNTNTRVALLRCIRRRNAIFTYPSSLEYSHCGSLSLFALEKERIMKYIKYGNIRIILIISLFIIDYYFINIFKQMYAITNFVIFSFEFQTDLIVAYMSVYKIFTWFK